MRGGYYQPKQQFRVVKTNENSGGVLEALRREHQGVTTGTSGTDSPPVTAAATVTVSYYESGSYTYLWGGSRGDAQRSRVRGGRGEKRVGSRVRGASP